MNRTAALFLAAIAATQPASAEIKSAETCLKGGDERLIEVRAPGEVGAACDLRYVRDSGRNVSVPYHANNSAGFCATRAAALVQSLTASGYQCAPVPVQAAAIPDAEELAGAAPADAAIAEIPPAPVVAAAPAPAPQILRQPATSGPVALASQSAEPNARGPRVAAVGRVVGAAPEPETSGQAATRPLLASGEESNPDALLSRSRPSADIIRSVLAAQVAAWNDGDLDAFMNGYWNSSELKFVSGTAMTKGFAPTLRRYREQYAQGGMGRLGFDNLEISVLTDDVAVATGRFRLDRQSAAETGAFTLVLRRFNGLWRIVHDHSAADAPAR